MDDEPSEGQGRAVKPSTSIGRIEQSTEVRINNDYRRYLNEADPTRAERLLGEMLKVDPASTLTRVVSLYTGGGLGDVNSIRREAAWDALSITLENLAGKIRKTRGPEKPIGNLASYAIGAACNAHRKNLGIESKDQEKLWNWFDGFFPKDSDPKEKSPFLSTKAHGKRWIGLKCWEDQRIPRVELLFQVELTTNHILNMGVLHDLQITKPAYLERAVMRILKHWGRAVPRDIMWRRINNLWMKRVVSLDDHNAPHWEHAENLAADDDTAARALENITGHGRLQKALEQLTSRQREVIDLKYFQGFSASEIGNKLGITSGRVDVILSESREKLRSLLNDPTSPSSHIEILS